jgi:Ca-activated chloride channel family protein
MAAEELRYTEEKATVILISDGKENCDADPCGTAKALESEGIDFVAHVIGFDVDKQTGEELRCIADATGGEYFSAENASALNDAMGKVIEKVQTKEAPKPVVKKPENNLKIVAVEVEGGPWIKASYSIYTDTGDEDVRGDHVTNCYSTKDKACKESIPVGNYIIESSYNKFNLKTPVTVKFGETSEVEILMGQTGKVNIIAREVAASPMIKARHYIYTDTGDEDERGDRVADCNSTKDKACRESIPVGNYIIESSYNKFNLKTPVTVKFGETSDVEIITGQTGKVELTASAGEAGKSIKARHYIYKDSGDEDERGDRVTDCSSSKDKPCKVRIPLGKYVAETKYEGETQKTPFELKAGETSKFNVSFTAAE